MMCLYGYSGLPTLVETAEKKIFVHIAQQCLICYDSGSPCASRMNCIDPSSLIFPFQVGFTFHLGLGFHVLAKLEGNGSVFSFNNDMTRNLRWYSLCHCFRGNFTVRVHLGFGDFAHFERK